MIIGGVALVCICSTATGYYGYSNGKFCSYGYGPKSGSAACSTSDSSAADTPTTPPVTSGGSGSGSGSRSGSRSGSS